MPDLRTDVEIIVADVAAEESLAVMCQRGLVILNCVGPVSVQQEVRCPPSLWLQAVILYALLVPSVQVLWRTSCQSLCRKWSSLPGHLW